MIRTFLVLAALSSACAAPPEVTPPVAASTPLKSATPESAARAYLATKARELALTPETLRLVHVHDTGRGGIVVIFRAQQQGVDLVERDVKVLLTRALTPLTLVTRPTPPGTHLPFVLSEADAVALAMKQLPGSAPLRRPARAWRVYFPTAERLVPAFKVELLRDDDAFAFIVDAFAARVLRATSLTSDAAFTYRTYADATGSKTPWDGPIADFTPHPTGLPDGSRPAFATPSLITLDAFNGPLDAWLGAGATQSQGNNVDAYTDDGNPDGFSANDVRAITTSAATFDFSFDTAQAPTGTLTQRRAVVTNAFYVTNWLHDDWYDSGFDEAAGNAQASNYGRGGVEGDAMKVAVQYAPTSQRNNANASTPADGESPELHFFLFDAVPEGSLSVAGESRAWAPADFGAQSFNVTGDVVLVNDGSAAPTLGCNTLVNNVAGKLALFDRGTCTFASKAQRAQLAGAIGVIIINNVAGAPPFAMTGTGTLTIPVMGLASDDGVALKAALQQGPVSATMLRLPSALRDSALDNTIVSHEWGHYLHHRLTDSSTLMTDAQSEGWGDFSALRMMLRPGDALNGTYACAQYAMGDAYFGIRRVPYSTDFTKNALTFKHVADGVALPAVPTLDNGGPNSEVHNAGEVWATALFQAYVALQTRAQGGAYTFADARRRMADYVVAGMKLSVADATFTEMRDALLMAAVAHDATDALVMAQAFALRGFGSCAVSPPRDSSDFTGVVESFAVASNPSLRLVSLADDGHSCDHDGFLDSGETGQVTVRVENASVLPLSGATLTVSSALTGLDFPSGATVTVPTVAPFSFVELQVPVRLALSVTGAQVLDVTAALVGAVSCAQPATATRWWHANVDELPASSSTDAVEAASTSWTSSTLLDGGGEANSVWRRAAVDAGETAWHADDFATLSGTALVSPELLAGDAGLVLTFRHRYRFEQSDGTNWDGALLEMQADGGAWQTLTLPSYGGAIGTQAGNPLGGRAGFVGESAGWPGFVTETVTLGAPYAGRPVRVRFVVGSDEAGSGYGWDLDDLSFSGATNTPFATLQAQATACAPLAPVADAQTLATPEDNALNLTLTAAGTGTLTFAVLTPPAHGTLTGTPPALTYTPDADFHGNDGFTFSASDGYGGAGSATVSLEVTAVNDTPVALDDTASTNAATPVTVTLQGEDVDGDALTFAVATQPAHGTLTGTPPDVTYAPEAGFSGEDTFTFTATDGMATSAPATVTVTVIGTVTLDAGTSTDGGMQGSDAGTTTDGGTHTPDGGTSTADGGTGPTDPPKGCGCTSGFELLPVAFLLLFRRSRR